MTSSTNLKKWALGKEFKADPWQGFTSPQFQDMLAKMGDDGEKECACVRTYSSTLRYSLAGRKRASAVSTVRVGFPFLILFLMPLLFI